tara:strand:+ start:20 stop:589 length:570 start_codon:yes stop_codon:yes gene_type:complete
MAVHSRSRCETVPTSKGIAPYATGTGTLSTWTLAGGPQQLNAWAITITMERGGTYAFGTFAQGGSDITFTATPTAFGAAGDTTSSYQVKNGKIDSSPSQTNNNTRVVITNVTRTNAANNFQGKPMTFFAETMSADGSAAAVNYKTTDYAFRSHPGQSGQLTDPWVEDDAITIEFFNEPFDSNSNPKEFK